MKQLTTREKEVIVLLALGVTQKDAASRLKITKKTLQKHSDKAYKKLGLHCAIDVLRYCLKHGIITHEQFINFRELSDSQTETPPSHPV